MIDRSTFRDIFATFPSGVAIVTAVGDDGILRGLTCNAVCSVSLDPPLLLVCVDKRSETLRAIQESDSFVVNFLATGRDMLSDRFATKHPYKFRGLLWRSSPLANGAPVLEHDIAAHAVCKVTQAIVAGDHWVLVGEVVDGAVDEAVPPLVYCRRRYALWTPNACLVAGVESV